MFSGNGRQRKASAKKPSNKGVVRYAVVGLGHIAQTRVLPAFANAKKNSRLTALVSGDATKQRKLASQYQVEHVFDYEEFESACEQEIFDAVYIALPNDQHAEYTRIAARAGIHVLCEKPLAPTTAECQDMIDAARQGGVKLMTAYRLHFETANLETVKIVTSGKLGDIKFFNSLFSMQVRPENIRTKAARGGGPLYDIGIYCINAARYVFRDEPTEVFGAFASGNDVRFEEVEEGCSVIMRFPGDRPASFTCSFGAADTSYYQVVGTLGDLRVDPAYDHSEALRHVLTVKGRKRERTFPVRDQFAPELLYFSDCVLTGRDPEPGGEEGLLDVQIIEAIFRSAQTRRPVKLEPLAIGPSPKPEQEIRRPRPRKANLVKVESPHF